MAPKPFLFRNAALTQCQMMNFSLIQQQQMFFAKKKRFGKQSQSEQESGTEAPESMWPSPYTTKPPPPSMACPKTQIKLTGGQKPTVTAWMHPTFPLNSSSPLTWET